MWRVRRPSGAVTTEITFTEGQLAAVGMETLLLHGWMKRRSRIL
jgi:hypothetical protein